MNGIDRSIAEILDSIDRKLSPKESFYIKVSGNTTLIEERLKNPLILDPNKSYEVALTSFI